MHSPNPYKKHEVIVRRGTRERQQVWRFLRRGLAVTWAKAFLRPYLRHQHLPEVPQVAAAVAPLAEVAEAEAEAAGSSPSWAVTYRTALLIRLLFIC